MNTTTEKCKPPKGFSSWCALFALRDAQSKTCSDLRSARLAVLRAALVGDMEQFSAAARRYRKVRHEAHKLTVLANLDIKAKQQKRQTLLEER